MQNPELWVTMLVPAASREAEQFEGVTAVCQGVPSGSCSLLERPPSFHEKGVASPGFGLPLSSRSSIVPFVPLEISFLSKLRSLRFFSELQKLGVSNQTFGHTVGLWGADSLISHLWRCLNISLSRF